MFAMAAMLGRHTARLKMARPDACEAAQALVKQVRRLNHAGQCALPTILLAQGFDAGWFNNGQRGLPGT